MTDIDLGMKTTEVNRLQRIPVPMKLTFQWGREEMIHKHKQIKKVRKFQVVHILCKTEYIMGNNSVWGEGRVFEFDQSNWHI